LFVHEFGHGFTVEALGGDFVALYARPGFQIYPRPGLRYEGEWGTAFAKLVYSVDQDWDDWREGLVGLMGCGTNLVLAALALGGLWAARPRGWLRHLLIAEALMFTDMLLYTVLPELFGLPNMVFVGGRTPEPVNGAELLGCPRPLFVVLVVIVSALMTWSLVRYALGYCVPEA
jgi:hypothetical protein